MKIINFQKFPKSKFIIFSIISLMAFLATWFIAATVTGKPFPGLALIGNLKSQSPNNEVADNKSSEFNQSEFQLYSNVKYNFSVQLPEGFSVSELKEKNGDIILIQGQGTSFQIFVMPFNEPGPLTPERIKKDVPALMLENPAYVNIGEVQALSFYNQNQDSGKTYEVWLMNRNYLYQLMAYQEHEKLIKGIIETWEWK